MPITTLVQAVQTLNAEDAFRPRFDMEQWRILGAYFVRQEFRSGQTVIRQGQFERSMYFLEQGSMQVFVDQAAPGKQRIALLRAGAVVGEPAMFASVPRMANVEAMSPCVAWELGGIRLDELSLSKPAIALEFLRAAGAVMAVRMRLNLERGLPLV